MNGNEKHLLDVRHLSTSFFTSAGEVKAVNDVSYYVDPQEIVAIVGESGCGKSVTQMSVLQLVQTPPGKIVSGEVLLEGDDLLKYPPKSKEMRSVRGGKISMIFQEPMSSLNPVLTIGNQLTEVIMAHNRVNKREAEKIAMKALESVGIPDVKARMKNFPFEMSGGMRQRVMISTAIACGAKLIIADEPTTALDVTTQAQVMELLLSLVKEQHASIVVVTHNLGLVTRYADRIYVMYAGRIIESGTTEELLTQPKHPYTKGLLQSIPRLDQKRGHRLVPIEGMPPNLADMPEQCAFLPRCKYADDDCRNMGVPQLQAVTQSGRCVACHHEVGEKTDE